jgi:hypothetical protein
MVLAFLALSVPVAAGGLQSSSDWTLINGFNHAALPVAVAQRRSDVKSAPKGLGVKPVLNQVAH